MVLPSLSDCAASIDRLAPVLLDTAPRSVLVLGLAGLAALAMRRASAAARHWVWLLGFAGLLLLPALMAMVPDWRVLPRMDRDHTVVTSTIAPPSVPVAPAPIQLTTRIDPQPAQIQPEPAAVSRQETAGTPTPAPAAGAARTSLSEQARGVPWTTWLVLIWLTGTVLVLGHLLLGYLSLWWLQRRSSPINDGEWSDLLARLRGELQVRGPVQLLSSPLRTMPMTWGLWRTRLLLPDQAKTWPPEQRRSVLLHELAHVSRRDCLAQLWAQVACAVYWFNPLVWVGWSRMQVERERACDDLVLNTGAKASAYARHLLDSASSLLAPRFVGAAVAMARPSTLEERLCAILDARRNRHSLSVASVVGMMVLLTIGLLPLAALQAQEAPPADPTPAAGPTTNPSTTRPSRPAPAFRRVDGGGGYGAVGTAGVAGFGEVEQRMRTRRDEQLRDTTGGGPGRGPTCSLDATIYRVHLPADQIGRLDLGALNKASASAEEFEKALTALGPITPLYRAGQSVRLAGDSIQIGTQTPYVTASRADNGGRAINTVQYSSTGAIFNMAGRAGGSARIELDLSIELSSMTDSNTEVGGGVKAPLHRTAKMSHKGMVDANKPFVVVSVDAASLDAAGKAVAYIARVTLGPPEGGEAGQMR